MAATPKKPAAKTARKGAAKERKRAPVKRKQPPESLRITARQQRFIDEYLRDPKRDASACALRAGFADGSFGRRLLSDPRYRLVQEAVAAGIARASERAEIDAAFVLRQWADIATADPNDLVQYRRGCCRHCWGVDHAYQWTEAELAHESAKLINAGKPRPDAPGGTGFDVNREPNPACPECGGEGRGRMIVADTRRLSGAARRLYAGVKLGKDGLEVKMRDQDAALANIAKHLGMFPSRVELTGRDGGPVQHQSVPPDLSNLSDDELSSLEAIAAKLGRNSGPGDDPG